MSLYVTAAEVKQISQLSYLDFGATFASDAAYTTFIETYIARIGKLIDDFCGVPNTFFKASGLTVTDELYDGDGSQYVKLNHRPLVSFTSMAENEAASGDAVDWKARTKGPGAYSHYLVYLSRGMLWFYDEVPAKGQQNIKVTYVAGYATVPGPVAQVAVELVSDILKKVLNRKLSPEDLTELALQGGDVGRLYATDIRLSDNHRKILSPYRVAKVSAG